MTKSIKVMIYIDAELKKQAEAAAQEDMRSFSNYVAVAIKEKLERDNRKQGI
jgi:predicted HicB family RNase H-like nuclease